MKGKQTTQLKMSKASKQTPHQKKYRWKISTWIDATCHFSLEDHKWKQTNNVVILPYTCWYGAATAIICYRIIKWYKLLVSDRAKPVLPYIQKSSSKVCIQLMWKCSYKTLCVDIYNSLAHNCLKLRVTKSLKR
jgi:hypothetical protein